MDNRADKFVVMCFGILLLTVSVLICVLAVSVAISSMDRLQQQELKIESNP